MKLLESSDKHALFNYGEGQCQLQLTLADQPIDRGEAYGRVAFSCHRNQVSQPPTDLTVLMKLSLYHGCSMKGNPLTSWIAFFAATP